MTSLKCLWYYGDQFFSPTHLANKYGHKEIVHNKSLGGMTVVKVKEEHGP